MGTESVETSVAKKSSRRDRTCHGEQFVSKGWEEGSTGVLLSQDLLWQSFDRTQGHLLGRGEDSQCRCGGGSGSGLENLSLLAPEAFLSIVTDLRALHSGKCCTLLAV